jgi:4-hydroxy-tetrahydrodipicolinate synthase
MQSLIGTGVALVTPFKKDFSVDSEALTRIVNFQIDNGIDYLVILGTTAENSTLNQKEKELVIQTIVDANNARLPLVLGIGGNNTSEIVKELKELVTGVGITKFAIILFFFLILRSVYIIILII